MSCNSEIDTVVKMDVIKDVSISGENISIEPVHESVPGDRVVAKIRYTDMITREPGPSKLQSTDTDQSNSELSDIRDKIRELSRKRKEILMRKHSQENSDDTYGTQQKERPLPQRKAKVRPKVLSNIQLVPPDIKESPGWKEVIFLIMKVSINIWLK